MARKIAVTDHAVAVAAVNEMVEVYGDAYDISDGARADLLGFAAYFLECASKVRFQPSTRQLVLTFDLDMSGEKAAEPLSD